MSVTSEEDSVHYGGRYLLFKRGRVRISETAAPHGVNSRKLYFDVIALLMHLMKIESLVALKTYFTTFSFPLSIC